ncbi:MULTISPECIES: hypothetical protein [Kitasatospora]|uniref:hypothetical protein n=1 Tax=Kitasatospora TaxID=2063 RepID=UPI000C279704|nr:hypothetical protein [Kitasatospora sp. CB02891]PJN21132.1 hypothetical protein CG736_34895 [Kitasatospora sp. CB02891]
MRAWALFLAVVGAAGVAGLRQRIIRPAADPVTTPVPLVPTEWQPPNPFDAPLPAQAYTGAPSTGDELENLLRLELFQDGQPISLQQQREYLLRWAALRDRLAVRAFGTDDDLRLEILRAANGAAKQLQVFDQVWETTTGPRGPRAAEWDLPGGSRAYVRQEYALHATTRRNTP